MKMGNIHRIVPRKHVHPASLILTQFLLQYSGSILNFNLQCNFPTPIKLAKPRVPELQSKYKLIWSLFACC